MSGGWEEGLLKEHFPEPQVNTGALWGTCIYNMQVVKILCRQKENVNHWKTVLSQTRKQYYFSWIRQKDAVPENTSVLKEGILKLLMRTYLGSLSYFQIYFTQWISNKVL